MVDTCPPGPTRGCERQVVLPPSRIASLNGDILITASQSDARFHERASERPPPICWIWKSRDLRAPRARWKIIDDTISNLP